MSLPSIAPEEQPNIDYPSPSLYPPGSYTYKEFTNPFAYVSTSPSATMQMPHYHPYKTSPASALSMPMQLENYMWGHNNTSSIGSLNSLSSLGSGGGSGSLSVVSGEKDEEDEEEGAGLHRPREEVRRSRILSEQRRRNELREGFERLREALPPSNQRTSKANILDRAVQHIQHLTEAHRWLVVEHERVKRQEEELLRQHKRLTETLMKSGMGQQGQQGQQQVGQQMTRSSPRSAQ